MTYCSLALFIDGSFRTVTSDHSDIVNQAIRNDVAQSRGAL